MRLKAKMVEPLFVAALVSLLVVHAPATLVARQQALESAWSRELDKSHASPVTRVVKLLTKMKAQLDAEASKDADMYDKMVCWCETNEKEKTKAIADAETKDAELSSEIESRSAHVGQLSAEIAKSKGEIAENTDALDKATKIHEADAAKFREDEKEMVQAIANLRNAVTVLSRVQGTSMMQLSGSMLSGMRVLLRHAAIKYEVLVAGRAEARGEQPEALVSLRIARRRASSTTATGVDASLLSALDAHGAPVSDAFPLKFAEQLVAKAAHPSSHGKSFLQLGAKQPIYGSGSPASSGIYGVMSQMLEDFEGELRTMQKDAERAQVDFKALAATKADEVEAGKAKLDEMQSEDAANSKALSDAKEDLAATRKQRAVDVEFLQNLKVSCDDLDARWEKRSQTRTAETKAVAEAIAILTEEDARTTLSRSVSLLQERSQRRSGAAAAAAAAAAALRDAAQAPEFRADDLLAAWHGRQGPGGASSPSAAAGPRAQLSTLAMAVQLDSFTKVKEMMDTMIAELKKQQADEVKFKDSCQKELRGTEREVADKTQLKKDLETKLSQLESLTTRLGDEIGDAKKQLSETEVEIKKASQTREEENKEFQSVVADQRATQTILKKALMKLKDFYEKGLGKAALTQRSDQTPPVQFNDYEDNAGSKSVIGLMEQIVEDSKALEAEAVAGEKKAHAEYESFVKDSNAIIKSLQESVASKTKAIAAAKGDSAEASSDLQSTAGELESLASLEADLHSECDWLLKNFDVRQKARLQEIESVQQAKAILSGA